MLDRRRFLLAATSAAVMVRQGFAMPTLNSQRAFLGTTGKDSQGIFFADFDPATGAFSTPEFAAKFTSNDCMTLSPKNHKRLYALCAVEGIAAVTGFDLVDGPSPLKQINLQTAAGTTPNFLALDPTGRVAMEANWGSGSINTYLVDKDGALSPAVEHIEYGDAHHGPTPSQPHSRCHSIMSAPGGRFVLVNDFGADRIYIYTLDTATAKLTPHDPPFYQAEPGSAPRHMVLHPNGKWIYCNNEVSNKVDLLLWDAKAGTLTLKSSLSTLPADAPPKCRTADIVLSHDLRFLYGSNRGLESFVVWSVQHDGTLQQIQFMKSEGVENRHLLLDATGKWVIAANARSNDIAVFPRDPKTGMMGAQHSSVKLPGACFVQFV
jgi:6-phosphogluconolactonase